MKYDLIVKEYQAKLIREVYKTEDILRDMFPHHKITVDVTDTMRVFIHGNGKIWPIVDLDFMDINELKEDVKNQLGEGDYNEYLKRNY